MASVRLQDYGGFQDKQNYACLVARVALEKYASGREISNQQSCKQSLGNNTKLDCIRNTAGVLLQLLSFMFVRHTFETI